MRRTAWMVGLGSVSIAVSSLCGCSWDRILPSDVPSLPNAVAVDRALRLCSISEGDQPFHIVLDVSPPERAGVRIVRARDILSRNMQSPQMQAQIEIFWLNPITYRTVIRSRNFSQIRIVNGGVVEEHDTGDFYPRWIQNFVDAILDPVPKADLLRKTPGVVPVGVTSHACISTSRSAGSTSDETNMAQLCFQDAEPRIASGVDFTRSVWFDDFAPFGSQQIARTVVNDLPANVLIRGVVTLLEPLRKSDRTLLRAREFTPSDRQIQTTLVPSATAQSLLEFPRVQSWPPVNGSRTEGQAGAKMAIYVRTDRTGRVREAYRDSSDSFGLQDVALARALTLKFRPLIVNGVPRQMEAPLVMP